MLIDENIPVSPVRQRIRALHRTDETRLLDELLQAARVDAAESRAIRSRARQLVESIRCALAGKGGVDALLTEFSLSTEEGVVLMCLAEALLRVPDRHNIDQLIRDKLSSGDWAAHLGKSDSLFVNASAWGLLLTGKVVQFNDGSDRRQLNLLQRTVGRMGEPVIRQAVRYALRIMGTQFVLGTTIHLALQRARKEEAKGFRYSYDMLGEGARTEGDARRYLQSYERAVESIGAAAAGRGPIDSPGISVKLSALHPRYEFAQRRRVMQELVPRLKRLALLARHYDIGLTVDAEEAERLDLSLDIIEAVFRDPELDGWQGFGLAIQAYQKRAIAVVEWANDLAAGVGRQLMVRLVKGAYWDTEIKLAQVEGFSDYPVFTSKPATDVSYLACARKLLQYRDNLYPQFATHNAYTVAAILSYDRQRSGFEFQRLHGMGEELFVDVMAAENIPCRIYAPVGEHADLLAYLVRRLLENGANTSFVNNIVDKNVSMDMLLADPVATVDAWANKRNTAIPLPADLFGGARRNAAGLDLSDPLAVAASSQALHDWWQQRSAVEVLRGGGIKVANPARREQLVGSLDYTAAAAIDDKLQRAHKAFVQWNETPCSTRIELLQRLADTLEAERETLMALCIKEAGKTADDSVAEVREAVDFCRYYAEQAALQIRPGDSGRGVVLCISPWNFPLAIFIGQISAALVAGNTVIAKAAEQTGLIAMQVIELMDACGFPPGVVELVVAPGQPVGEQLLPDPRIQAVMFTGSTAVAKWLSKAIAARAGGDIPLIAETGGQNAMIVDSTALPEQVVDDVIQSGFHSAGQRCSALRVLFIQEEVADKIIDMIAGAMAELRIGDPADLATDVGPVIDQRALARLQRHTDALSGKGQLRYRCELSGDCRQGSFIAPHLFEIDSMSQLREEIFGPVVHIVRYRAAALDDVIAQINRSGFGLTLGIHSRIQAVKEKIAAAVQVGNIYINRNMVGAVVGVQPFGGRGLSGTGPKAGGPRYLARLLRPQPLPALLNSATVQSAAVPAQTVETVAAHGAAAAAPASPLDWQNWNALPLTVRAGLVRHWIKQWATLPEAGQSAFELARQLIGEAESELEPQLLPGPTGESNRLCTEGRGVLLAYIERESELPYLLVAAAVALVTGNAMIFAAAGAQLRDKLAAIGSAAGTLPFAVTKVDGIAADLSERLRKSTLAGVVLSADSGLAPALRAVMAESAGAILPLINEPLNRFYLQRFVLEKTVSEDTTAAGGNASLMTLEDTHETAGSSLQQAV